MDWKSFIASMVGSLAWPVIVGALVYLLRDDLPELVRRIKNASLPGTKIEFNEALDKFRNEREVAAIEKPAPAAEVPIDPVRVELAERFPEAAVMEAFKSVEALLLEARTILDLAPRSNLLTVVRKLVERKVLDSEGEVLFRSLQTARNAAAHGGGQNARISPGEALDFVEQARFFQGILIGVLDKLHGQKR